MAEDNLEEHVGHVTIFCFLNCLDDSDTCHMVNVPNRSTNLFCVLQGQNVSEETGEYDDPSAPRTRLDGLQALQEQFQVKVFVIYFCISCCIHVHFPLHTCFNVFMR